MSIKTTELNPLHAVQTAQIGAAVLSEIRRILEQNGISVSLDGACLASAVCGFMKSMEGTEFSIEDFIKGVESCNSFWKVEDEQVVFLGPDVETISREISEMSDDKTSN